MMAARREPRPRGISPTVTLYQQMLTWMCGKHAPGLGEHATVKPGGLGILRTPVPAATIGLLLEHLSIQHWQMFLGGVGGKRSAITLTGCMIIFANTSQTTILNILAQYRILH